MRPDMRKLVGQRVREAREAKRLTRPELASLAQTSIDTIKRVELDSNEPGANVLATIAAILDVSLESLFTETEAVA